METVRFRSSARVIQSNQMQSSTQRKIVVLSNEYHFKVSHDFSCYVYFGKTGKNDESLEDAIQMITSYRGYEAHRMIHHKGQTSHFYIRFLSTEFALEAVARIKQTKMEYVADTVDRILLGWYLFEMSSGTFPWTLALVDVVGNVDHTNLLSEDSLQGVLFRFGDPRICGYSNVNSQINHVQVLFSSMSEALGASIAFGCWYRKTEQEHPFYYRLKIVSSNKEISLLKKCVDPPSNQAGDLEAFDLDYFMPKVSNARGDVLCNNPGMQYQEANDFMIQPSVPEDLVSRPRPYRRQFSRGRGNSRNRMRAPELQRNARQNSRSFSTLTEHLPGPGLVPNS